MTDKSKVYRLFKVAKELNVGSSTLVDHLESKGFEIRNSPNEKLSEEMYNLLLKDFASEKVLKQKAEQIREQKKERKVQEEVQVEEDEHISAEDLRTEILTGKKTPAEETEKKPEVKAESKPEEKAEESEKDSSKGIKVVGKIDLDAISGKKKKEEAKQEPQKEKPAAKKEEEKKPEKKAVPEKEKQEEKIAAEKPEVRKEKEKEKEKEPEKKELEEKIEKLKLDEKEQSKLKEMIQAGDVKEEDLDEEKVVEVIRASEHTPKLQGIKVVGKIELPEEKKKKEKEKAAEESESKKRKRKRKRKRKSTTAVDPEKVARDAGKKKKSKKEEPSDKEIQEIIKSTLADLNKKSSRSRQRLRRKKRDEGAARREAEEKRREEASSTLEVTEFITANEFANLIDVGVNEIITKCMELGLFVSINQRLEADVITLLAEEYGYEVSFVDVKEAGFEEEDTEEDLPEATETRPPIITVMGHVDHGKTSLLDYVRKENVIAGEAGGITQHIGAYEVTLPGGEQITFLDTPGHEAFTAMRARGAKVTDLAIIVIAADDSVMPQTKEAINHAQAAGVPMIFAINKIDKDNANPDRIREQLAQMNLLVEEWGGKYSCQEISAKKGLNIDKLLEKVVLEAEILELKANAERRANGTVIEAKLDKGRGVVTTLLVQNGTLKIGDTLVAGVHFGKIKAMYDERGNRIEEAGPSTPVQVLGMDGIPQAGDTFRVYQSERKAKEIANRRSELYREQSLRSSKHITLEEIARRKAIGDFQELNLIVKGDVDGSVEALSDSLLKLSTEEVQVNIIMKGVGGISESDVLLASASDAVIIGFQVRPSAGARKVAENEQIDIRLYSIIYDAINDVKDALEGLLSPEIKEEIMGTAEVRDTFKVSKVGTVAGCMVIDGKMFRNDPVRLIREGIVIYDGKLASLKRFKDDVKEVATGFECGIMIEGYNDVKVGDIIEGYREREVKRSLS